MLRVLNRTDSRDSQEGASNLKASRRRTARHVASSRAFPGVSHSQVRRGLWSVVCLCALAALSHALLASDEVSAHGPAPTPLRVLHVAGGQADVIQTNIGLAVRKDGVRYRYGCPSQWGDLETPLSAALSDEVVMVAGPDALYLSDDRGCNFAPIDDPLGVEEVRLAALTDDRGVIFGLEKGASSSQVFAWSLEAGLQQASLIEQPMDSLVVTEGGATLMGARPELTVIQVADAVSLPWDVQAARHNPAPPGDADVQRAAVRLVDAGDASRIWAAATTGQGVEWWRSDDGGRSFQIIAEGELAIHGPVPLCGGVAAVIDGILTPDPDFPPRCDISGTRARNFNCLGERDGLVWACELRQLFELHPESAGDVDEGGSTEQAAERLAVSLIFTLDELDGPGGECPFEPDARVSCEQDWLHFGAESGLINPEDIFGAGGDEDEGGGDDQGDEVSPDERAGGQGEGCGVVASASSPRAPGLLGGVFGVLVVLCGVRIRRGVVW